MTLDSEGKQTSWKMWPWFQAESEAQTRLRSMWLLPPFLGEPKAERDLHGGAWASQRVCLAGALVPVTSHDTFTVRREGV